MWPWGHLAVGYLCYSVLIRFQRNQYSTAAVVALVFGTQFPDLVDKPLAWTFGLLPNGRSLGHSFVVVTIVAVVLFLLAKRLDKRTPAVAFMLGYITHLGGDVIIPVVEGQSAELAFLLWPILPPIQYEGSESISAHFLAAEVTSFFIFQLGLTVFAMGIWYLDGLPGQSLFTWTRQKLAAVITR